MTEKQLKTRQQAFALSVCTIVFVAVYKFCTWYASSLDNVPSFAFDFERSIPFLPLSIIPYMAGGLFFGLVFFFCKDKYQIKILAWRMLFVIIVAGIFFVTVPLKFSFEKPLVSSTILGLPFSFLKDFDSPFNQSPSLHITFSFVFWTVFKDVPKWRFFFLIMLILVGISTLTTFQHHFIDVVTGAILAHLSFILIPYRKNNPEHYRIHIANYYFLACWVLVFASLLIFKFFGMEGLLILFPAVILLIIGFYHQKIKGTAAIQKLKMVVVRSSR